MNTLAIALARIVFQKTNQTASVSELFLSWDDIQDFGPNVLNQCEGDPGIRTLVEEITSGHRINHVDIGGREDNIIKESRR